MMKRQEVLLLSIIKNSGNIRRLTRENISFKEISDLTSKLVNEELIQYVERKIVLTKKGKQVLAQNIDQLKDTNKELWIKPENKSRIKKHERNFIYLPLQTELDF